MVRRVAPSVSGSRGRNLHETYCQESCRCWCRGAVIRSVFRRGQGAGIHQRSDGGNLGRLLSARRRAVGNLRPAYSGRTRAGAGDQGVGGKPQSAAGRARRNRLHAGRLAQGSLGRQHGSGLPRQARQAARHCRDLSQFRSDRRVKRIRHHFAGAIEGQEPVGRRASIGHRAECARDLRGGGPDLFRSWQAGISAICRIG